MAEVITEMIKPGTYIEVRAEGLLSIGAVATGNVGLIGTAEKGDGTLTNVSSFDEGRAHFGEISSWNETDIEATAGNLTLLRALKLLFANGARTVYAQRVYDPSQTKRAVYAVQGESGSPLLSLRARTPGTWGNRLQIRVQPADVQALVSNEEVIRSNGTITLTATQLVQPATPEEAVGSVQVRDAGLLRRYQLRTSGPGEGVVGVNPANRQLTFPATPDSDAEIRASYMVPSSGLRQVTLRYGNVQEVYTVPSMAYLVQQLQDERNPSQLVEVVSNGNQPQNVLPRTTTGFIPFTGGENGGVGLDDFQNALDVLVDENVQLVVVAGLSFSAIRSAVLGHVEKTENLGRERIAVLGADDSKTSKVLENASDVADKRVVLVAPGLTQTDPETGRFIELPPYFTAAAVAGKLAGLSPHISLTNKTLAGINGLDETYNYGEITSLLQNRVLAVEERQGLRVIKGISTDDGAFRQISIRRTIDYIKKATRMGCNQYIGRLNNRRVREAMRTTLDSFLSNLITREFLTDYKLTVDATRAMEIRGEVQVVMDLQPTFSIDYIRVTMNLS